MKDEAAPSAGSDFERRFQNLVENIPGIVVYLDLVQPDDPGSSLPVYISPQVEDLLGYERAAWLTEDELWLDVLHPDDRDRMVEADAQARGALSTLFAEYRMVARDGRVVWVSEKAAVVQDEVSGNHYWQGVMVDITDRKQVEDALAASERQYRSVFDAATIGLMTLDLTGRVLDANDVVEQVLGYPAGALHGLLLPGELDESDESRRQLEALAVGAVDRCELEHRLRTHDGSQLWCRTVMALVRNSVGSADHVTAMVENIDQRKQAEADLVRRTTHDPLTTLPNREHFLLQLAQARLESPATMGVGVVFVDLDNFKSVNDSFGHDAGDELLVAVARRLRAAVRPADLVARFGGDEFLVLADHLGEARDVAQLAWRLATSLNAPFAVAGRAVTVTASFGAAFSRDLDEPDEDLVRKADAAMYSAKHRGSNRVALFGESESSGAGAAA
jgi:diguanylate cyclase (GGDEF)-like protein/PAS domain S-box-containing protein